MTTSRWVTVAVFAAFVATVVGANWALGRYGIIDFAGLGFMVPAGVYFAGAAFGLRDALHELGGRRWVLAAIAIGGVVSWWVEGDATIPGGHVAIALASAAAFTVSELADFAVYDPLRERNWPSAVVASQVAGSLVDSVLFLWLAFGATTGWVDLTVAKTLMVAVTLPVVWGVRRAVPRYRFRAAGA